MYLFVVKEFYIFARDFSSFSELIKIEKTSYDIYSVP